MQAMSQPRFDEDQFKAVVESLHDFAIFMLDHHGNVLSWNAGAERITGRKAEEVMGRSFDLFFPSGTDVIRSERLLRLSGDDGQQEEEGWCVRKDGTRFWAEVLVNPLHTKGDVLVGFVAVIEDLERRRDSEHRLEQLIRDLDRSNSALVEANTNLESFTYTVSHDLKEPLRTIQSFSEFLQEDSLALDEGAKDHLHRITDAASRMQTMISQLLTYCGLGIAPASTESLNLIGLIHDVRETMTATIEERNARLIVAPDLPATCGERTRMEEVFQNLISNGLKFNRSPEPTIWIGLHSIDAASATIYVKDNGIGIEQDGLTRVFGMFERLQPRGEFEGTGAGLAIVKRAVESISGSISVESAPDVGTTFYLTFPLAETPAEMAA